MANRDQSGSSTVLDRTLAGQGLLAVGLRLRLSRELPAAYSTIRRGNAGQLLSF